MLAYHSRSVLLAGATLLASTQITLALDADDFAKKLTQAWGSGGAAITYDGATASGDNVTIENLRVGMAGEPATFGMGNLQFQGVKEDGSGNYNVASMAESEITFSQDEISFSISDISIENLYVPADSTANSIDNMFFYDRATTGPVVFNIEGNEVFKIARSDTRNTRSSNGDQWDFDARLDGLEIDLASVDDAQARQVITGMGYQNISGDMVIKGFWHATNGELTLSDYALTLNDVGRLGLSFSISGYTLEFVKSLQELQKNMAGKADDAKAQQAMGLAMMGMMQQLTFNNMALRFDDASLTNKVLDMVASQQGMSRDQMVQGVQGMLPFVLGQLNNPEFQKSVTEAVSLYLSDPRNIEVAARPESPVPFASVVGAAMGAPQSLPDVLNVMISANQ